MSKEVLPLPDGPQTATFSPGATVKERFLRTGAVSGLVLLVLSWSHIISSTILMRKGRKLTYSQLSRPQSLWHLDKANHEEEAESSGDAPPKEYLQQSVGRAIPHQ